MDDVEQGIMIAVCNPHRAQFREQWFRYKSTDTVFTDFAVGA